MGAEALKLQMELDQVMENIKNLERDIAAEQQRVDETNDRLQKTRENFFKIETPLKEETLSRVRSEQLPKQRETQKEPEREKDPTGNQYCPKCGNYVGEFRFCGKCGFEVNPEK